MKVAVCCKAVPKGIKKVKLVETRGLLDCESNSILMNECDEYALDAALLWKKEHGADITVITMGGIRTQDVLYTAIAKGADHAVRLDGDINESGAAAQIIAAAVKGKDYDMVITGVESEDNTASQVAISLAERLGYPYAMAVTKVEFLPDGRIQVAIEIGGGLQEELEMKLPAVLAIQSGITTLSCAALAKIMRARKIPIRSMGFRELGINRDEIEAFRPKITAVFEPPQAQFAELIGGSVEEIAEKILKRVKNVLG
jgi:electron transfer flavoprotein beta subunit